MANESGTWHEVAPGEWLNSIARQHKVYDPDRIWKHAENAKLASIRDRDILHPGDRIFIPPPRARKEDGATGQRHSFKRKTVHDRFEVTLKDPDGEPYQNVKYRLVLAGQEFAGQTDGSGTIKLEKLVLASGATGSLELPEVYLRYPISLGSLNPIDKTVADDSPSYDNGLSGALMRLRNLGFHHGPVPSGRGEAALDPGAVGEALTRFQIHEMGRDSAKASGELDDETRRAISGQSLA